VVGVSFAEDMNPACRSTMEDAHAVVDAFGGDPGCGYYGIYDGHGGRNVAEFLRLHLHGAVERELRDKGARSVEECMRAAFLAVDVECNATGEQASGSTAVVCVIRRQGGKRYVFTANVGDARAVLCHAGVAVRLSKDHKATDAPERARIEAAGGFVIRKRVMGVLAVARSFGDFVLKKYVTAEPYTSVTKVDDLVSPPCTGQVGGGGGARLCRQLAVGVRPHTCLVVGSHAHTCPVVGVRPHTCLVVGSHAHPCPVVGCCSAVANPLPSAPPPPMPSPACAVPLPAAGVRRRVGRDGGPGGRGTGGWSPGRPHRTHTRGGRGRGRGRGRCRRQVGGRGSGGGQPVSGAGAGGCGAGARQHRQRHRHGAVFVMQGGGGEKLLS
jgi:serine/threonine protein phosphatase PrpC